MKNFLPAVLILTFFLQCNEGKDTRTKTVLSQQFSSDTLHLSLAYPENWKLVQNPDHTNAIVLLENKEDSNDRYLESMQIWVEEMPLAIKDSVYFQAALTQLKITNPNINIQRGEKVKLGDNDFYAFDFDFKTGDDMLYSVKGYCLVKDKMGYNISCTSLQTDMQRHEEIFSLILKSLKPL